LILALFAEKGIKQIKGNSFVRYSLILENKEKESDE